MTAFLLQSHFFQFILTSADDFHISDPSILFLCRFLTFIVKEFSNICSIYSYFMCWSHKSFFLFPLWAFPLLFSYILSMCKSFVLLCLLLYYRCLLHLWCLFFLLLILLHWFIIFYLLVFVPNISVLWSILCTIPWHCLLPLFHHLKNFMLCISTFCLLWIIFYADVTRASLNVLHFEFLVSSKLLYLHSDLSIHVGSFKSLSYCCFSIDLVFLNFHNFSNEMEACHFHC